MASEIRLEGACGWPGRAVQRPLFNKVVLTMPDKKLLTIVRRNAGVGITDISVGGKKVDGYFISHRDLSQGGKLVIATQERVPAKSRMPDQAGA
jgi:putative alpha-1,2-mannosidase